MNDHPFQPGDRVKWHGEPNYGFKSYAGRVHYVERAWTVRGFITIHWIKLLGIEKPVSSTRFRLIYRGGGVSA